MGRFTDLVTAQGFEKALQTLLDDPGVHFFATDTIVRGLSLDPLDASRDADLAAEVLRAHLDNIMGQWKGA
jgi:hypothetical protein